MLKYRIFYILTLAATILFYLFFTGYLSFFLLAVTVLLPLVSWFFTLLAVRKMNLRMEIKTPYVNKDKEIFLNIVLKNSSFFSIARAELKFQCENALCGENRSETFFLPVSSGPEQTVEVQLKSRYCGKVTAGLTRIKYYDYLGIFSASQRLNLHADAFVAPQIYFLDLMIDTAENPGTESSSYSKVKPGDDPSEIFDIRPFRSGDRLRSIHWKLSSKLDELMVKEFSLPTDSSVLLLVDLMAKDMASLNTVVETLASLSRFLLENEINHNVEWYAAEYNLFHQNIVQNEEDLALLFNVLLSARQYGGETCALACHNTLNDTVQEFPHAIYITGQLTDALTTFCNNRQNGEKTTVLYCGEMDEGQRTLAATANALRIEVTEILPDKVQESLSGLMV